MARDRPEFERIVYAAGSPPFVATQRDALPTNRVLIEQWFGDRLRITESILDVHHALHCQHWWALRQYPVRSASDSVALASAHKNQYALFSALELLRVGLNGSARPIYRYIFESQCIAKFSRVRTAHPLGDRWVAGKRISLRRAVFDHLSTALKSPLLQFWTLLNQTTHATVFALQDSPFAEDNRDAIEGDLAVLTLLLAFEFHMLASHTYAPALQAYVRQYDGRPVIAKLLTEGRRLHRAASSSHSAVARGVRRAFACDWSMEDN